MTHPDTGREPPLWLAAYWGVLGVLALVGNAIWRLTPNAIEPIRDGSLTWWHWIVWAVWVAWMLVSEGYKGFQKQFAPRVAARAMYLARHPRPHAVVLAPLFCMGLFHATRKRLIVSWAVLLGIVTLVIIVRQLAQPWRGIIDAGVVIGLAYGVVCVLWFFGRALAGHPSPVPPDVPEHDER